MVGPVARAVGGATVRQYVGAAALDVFTEMPSGGVHVQAAQQLDLGDLLGDTGRTDLAASRCPASRGGLAASLPARVESAVTALAGSLRHELLGALLAEMRLEFARLPLPVAAVPRSTAAPSESRGTSPAPPWVQNTRAKVFHACGLGPDSGARPAEWSAFCGWSFGYHGGYVFRAPGAGAVTCDRCEVFAAKRLGLV